MVDTHLPDKYAESHMIDWVFLKRLKPTLILRIKKHITVILDNKTTLSASW